MSTLQAIATTLGDLEPELYPASEQMPIDTLFVPMGEGRHIQLNLIPDLEEDLRNSQVLQLYSPFDAELDEANAVALYRLLNWINVNNPISALAVREDTGEVFLRHCLVIPSDVGPPVADVIRSTLDLCQYMLEVFAGYVWKVGAGEMTLEEAQEEIVRSIE